MNIYGNIKNNLKESGYNANLNVNKIAKFLEDSVNDLIKIDEGCCRYLLDEDLALYVGWSAGWGEELRDDAIQSKSEPDYAIEAGIKVRNDTLWADYDWLDFPYYPDGEVWYASLTMKPGEDYKSDAQWFIDEYNGMREAIDKGEVLLESDKALKEAEDKYLTGEKYVCIRPIKHPNLGTLIGIDEVITLEDFHSGGYYSTDAGPSVPLDELRKNFKKYNGPVYIVKADDEEVIRVCSEDAAYDYADERAEWDDREFTIVNPDGKEVGIYDESEKLKEAAGKKISSNDIFDGVRLSFTCDGEPYYLYATWDQNFDFDEEKEYGNIPEDAENEEDWGGIYFEIYDDSKSGVSISGGLMITDKDEYTPQELASDLADLAGYMKVDNAKVIDSIPGYDDREPVEEKPQPNKGVTAKDLDSEGINYTVVGEDGKKMLLNFFLSSDGELEYIFYTYDGDEIDGGDIEIEDDKTWVNMDEVAKDILDFQGIKGSASMRLEDGSYEDAIDFISQNGMNESADDEYEVAGFDRGKELEKLHDDGTIEYDASAIADYIDEHFDERAETLKSGDKALRWTGSFDNLLDEAFDKLYGIDLSEYDDQYWEIENEVRGYLSYRGYETIYESEPETGAEEGDLVLRIDKDMNESEDDEEVEEKEPEEDDDFDEVAWDQHHLEEISKQYDDLDKAGAFSEVIIDTPTHKKWRQPNTNLYKDVSYDENGKKISSSIGREYHEAHKILGSMIREADELKQTYTIEYWPTEEARDEGYGEYLTIEAISIPDAIAQTKKYYYREDWESVELCMPSEDMSGEVLFGIYPEDGEVVYFKETEDVEVYGFNNQFNTTVKQVRVDYKNKTYKVGSFKMRNDKKLSRKDFYDKIDELEKSGFKQLKESDNLYVRMARNIDWETDGDKYALEELPKEVEIPDHIGEDEVADYLSDEYGWLVNSVDVENVRLGDNKYKGSAVGYLDRVLEDDGTSEGGISHAGETLREFIYEVGCGLKPTDSLTKINKALQACGIKPIKESEMPKVMSYGEWKGSPDYWVRLHNNYGVDSETDLETHGVTKRDIWDEYRKYQVDCVNGKKVYTQEDLDELINEAEEREWLKDEKTYNDFKGYVDSQLRDGAIDDPEHVKGLSDKEYEDLLVNTWMKDKDMLDMYEERLKESAPGLIDDDISYIATAMNTIDDRYAWALDKALKELSGLGYKGVKTRAGNGYFTVELDHGTIDLGSDKSRTRISGNFSQDELDKINNAIKVYGENLNNNKRYDFNNDKWEEDLEESVQNELKEVMKEANIKSINGKTFTEAAEAHNRIPRGWKRIVYQCKIDTSAGKAGDKYELTKNEYGEAIDKNLQTGQTYWPNWQIIRNPEIAEIIEIEKE